MIRTRFVARGSIFYLDQLLLFEKSGKLSGMRLSRLPALSLVGP